MVTPAEEEWTDWTVIHSGFALSDRVLDELLTGGQSFQWYRTASDSPVWIGMLGASLIELKTDQSGSVLYRTIDQAGRDRTGEDLHAFFRLDEDHAGMLASLPLDRDPYLARCVEHFRGLRILRQPIEEVLLTFLCSSNKQISQIRRMLAKLSERWGTSHYPGWFSYPGWEALAGASLEDLASCGTGYRGKYIQGCAMVMRDEPDFLSAIGTLPYHEAKAKLVSLPGVGPKVAECILLYGAGCYQSFPLDTWILKAMNQRYGLSSLSRKAMEAHAHKYFGPCAGIAQQYIFAYEREVRELSRS